jgi:hypothetical protein
MARRTRPSTRSPLLSNSPRRPAATAVSSTSFTVPPWAWAMPLMTSSLLRISASRRSEPTRRFRLVSGARPSPKASRTAGQPRRISRTVSPGWASLDRKVRPAWARLDTLSRNSAMFEGIGAGVRRDADGAAASGVKSRNAPKAATPATPSATAWCSFINSPTRPCARPGRNHNSHRGRDRSSGRRRSRSHADRNSASSAASSENTPTCRARSTELASTHRGHPSPRRGIYRHCRNRASGGRRRPI